MFHDDKDYKIECNIIDKILCSKCSSSDYIKNKDINKECPECNGTGIISCIVKCYMCNSNKHTTCKYCYGKGCVCVYNIPKNCYIFLCEMCNNYYALTNDCVLYQKNPPIGTCPNCIPQILAPDIADSDKGDSDYESDEDELTIKLF